MEKANSESVETIVVLVTAAGSSARFGGGKKEFENLDGTSVLEAALLPFAALSNVAQLLVTAPPGRADESLAAISRETRELLGTRLKIIEGGPTRRDSVRLGLEALAAFLGDAAEKALVLVHDGARPWASAALVERALRAAREKNAALPVVPLSDTPKEIAPDGSVVGHPGRDRLAAAQTPQAFRLGPLLEAHRRALAEGINCTDDAELWARYVGPVSWFEGETANRKITYRADLPTAAANSADAPFRIGEGWDLHRLVSGRRLMVGGVQVPADFGEEAHSDGDVLLHALIDALLGAAALGDIGTHFPPSESRWKDADSRELAKKAASLVEAHGWIPVNVDCTVTLERPRLGPHREAIRTTLASILGIGVDRVSLKAKTSEGVDAVGEGRAIEARVVALLSRSRAK